MECTVCGDEDSVRHYDVGPGGNIVGDIFLCNSCKKFIKEGRMFDITEVD